MILPGVYHQTKENGVAPRDIVLVSRLRSRTRRNGHAQDALREMIKASVQRTISAEAEARCDAGDGGITARSAR